MGSEGQLSHPETELWFPIAPDVAVSPWGKAMTETLFEFAGNDVRRVNETIFKHSTIIAARSEALLRSLARL